MFMFVIYTTLRSVAFLMLESVSMFLVFAVHRNYVVVHDMCSCWLEATFEIVSMNATSLWRKRVIEDNHHPLTHSLPAKRNTPYRKPSKRALKNQDGLEYDGENSVFIKRLATGSLAMIQWKWATQNGLVFCFGGSSYFGGSRGRSQGFGAQPGRTGNWVWNFQIINKMLSWTKIRTL